VTWSTFERLTLRACGSRSSLPDINGVAHSAVRIAEQLLRRPDGE
jgi:hypothetical protein